MAVSSLESRLGYVFSSDSQLMVSRSQTALSIANFSLEEIPPEIGKLVQLRRFDLSRNRKLKELPESMYSLVELRSLLLAGCSLEKIHGIGLKQLELSENRELKESPESIWNLVELQFLSLAHCSLMEIHGGIGKLVQLRQLDSSLNKKIQELPESICNLVELQIMKIAGTTINCLPDALGELSNLCKIRVGSHNKKFGFLTKLYGLVIGSLEFEIYCSSMSDMGELVENAGEAQLKTLLQKLEELKIRFMGRMNETEQSSSPSLMWMKVVEALVPHHKLKQLTIVGYGGSRLQHWMSSSLNFIKQIDLCYLSEMTSLPAMGKLPLLENLHILYVEQLKLVGHEFLGIESSSDYDVVAFPKLKKLYFNGC